ncbi:sunset domain-containing protein [Kutzneria chonburiensis]
MWVFGQVWLLCLLAFVIGAGLDHFLFTRPLRKQVRQLEIQLAKAKRADAMPPPTPAETDVERTGIVADHPSSDLGWDPDRRPSWEREQESPRTLVAPTPEPDRGYGQPEPDRGYGQPEQDLGYAQAYEPEPPTTFDRPGPSAEPATSFEPLGAFDRPGPSAEPPTTFEPVGAFDRPAPSYDAAPAFEQPADHPAEPEPTPEPEPAVAQHEPEPEREPVVALEQPQPPADEQPTQIHAPIPAAPPIPNPSPAEMTAAINRLVGEANAAETTSILPPARDDHEDMELADVGPATPATGQLAHVPADDLEDEPLVDDVVDEELTESEREAAAETTGPVKVSVIAAAEKAVQERRLAGELAEDQDQDEDREDDRDQTPRHSLAPSEPAHAFEPEHAYEAEPFHPVEAYEAEHVDAFQPVHAYEPQPDAKLADAFHPVHAYAQQEPEAAEDGEVQLEALAEPIRLDPNQFGKPIPPGALTPPGSVTPPEPAESESPLPTRPARPEPAPIAAVSRPRSLFEPVLDPDGEDPYDDLDGFAPIQEPTTRSFSSTDSVPFTPILAPELLANEQPKPPVITSTPAGLPKRTVSSSWPRGGNGVGAGPQPFDPAPFRPRALGAMPRNTDAAPIRRPSSGGPRTPFGPGSALPKPDGSAPSDDFSVKAVLGSRTYHAAGSGDFDAVKAEVWFHSTDEAERAGFTPGS